MLNPNLESEQVIDQFLTTKHGKTRYILNGTNLSAPTDHLIVFVCGISSHSYSFHFLVKALMKQYESLRSSQQNIKYLRYDKYGRGKSSNPLDILHDGDLFVEQLYELIDGVELKPRRVEQQNNSSITLKPRITIIGFSMGGAIATLFASKHSDLVDDLILFSPAGAKWKLPFGSSLVKVSWLGSVVYGAIHNASTTEQKISTGLFNLNDELVKERVKFAVEMKEKEDESSSQISSFVNSFTNFPLTAIEDKIQHVGTKSHMKIMVIWALFDVTVPGDECLSTYFTLLGEHPKSRFAIMNNTRHMFYMEREEDTAKLIYNFLNDSNDDGDVFERSSRALQNIQQQSANEKLMTSSDKIKLTYFTEHPVFKKFII
ncbi:hypothetical protein C9374_007258 [Naegleria lovaniensis]|uniref:Serine aminopeptidase S33 domain-containing protein n=1 Tax=Naegleria lovaniensis TaxID=51637 RepID=A0AA88KS16_NAELO|nr:uncharacterized protein C9374_007258 [Naegleria lovaniensis]KAG2393727.1 hypothetical protein C9374_007258 [Naegleria lovaniensis]